MSRRDKLTHRLEELRTLRNALTPFAVKAGDRTEITLTHCPPFGEGSYSFTDADAQVLTFYLGACLEVARCEQQLARLDSEVKA